mmetsp:Transcript_27550/g.69464  ORF Transcript_27550/g.69464 Transcript_27550/m.69464 type:complete len:246 (+) Transcript_27550:2072-2809(+)
MHPADRRGIGFPLLLSHPRLRTYQHFLSPNPEPAPPLLAQRRLSCEPVGDAPYFFVRLCFLRRAAPLLEDFPDEARLALEKQLMQKLRSRAFPRRFALPQLPPSENISHAGLVRESVPHVLQKLRFPGFLLPAFAGEPHPRREHVLQPQEVPDVGKRDCRLPVLRARPFHLDAHIVFLRSQVQLVRFVPCFRFRHQDPLPPPEQRARSQRVVVRQQAQRVQLQTGVAAKRNRPGKLRTFGMFASS